MKEHSLLIGIFALCFFTMCQFPGNKKNVDNSFKSVITRQGDYKKKVDSGFIQNFNKYFANKPINSISLKNRNIGKLKLQSGKLVACDPFYAGEPFTCPFILQLPIGNYDVEVSIADLKDWGERIAFARLVISKNETVKWDSLSVTRPEDGFGIYYGVDSGLGSFMDSITAQFLAH